MTSGNYPYSMVDFSIGRDGLPGIDPDAGNTLANAFRNMEAFLPANLNGRDSFATDAIFATYVGRLRPLRSRATCSENLEIERLSRTYSCLGPDPGSHPAEVEGWNEILGTKETIYQGYGVGLFGFDGFGLQVTLADGGRYLVEADLTAVLNYRCDENIRELSCRNPFDAGPRTLDIGPDRTNSPQLNLWVVLAAVAFSFVVTLIWSGVSMTFRILFSHFRS